jgi:hypothetical protein
LWQARYFLDFNIKRTEIARYGLSVDDVQEIVQTAVGRMNLTTTVEGRQRCPVNVRYARELRNDVEKLKRVLAPVKMSAPASGGGMGTGGPSSGTMFSGCSWTKERSRRSQSPCSRRGDIPASTSSAATASRPTMIRLWKTCPATSSGRHFPKSGCSNWIKGTVIYTSKDGATTKNFSALEWLAAMCSYIPNRGEQMVRCQGTMRIISSIEDPSVIREILKHLGLCLIRARPPPRIHTPWGDDAALCPQECAAHDLQPQAHADMIYGDPEYSWDAYIHA